MSNSMESDTSAVDTMDVSRQENMRPDKMLPTKVRMVNLGRVRERGSLVHGRQQNLTQ